MRLDDYCLGVDYFMRSKAWYEPLSCPSPITVYAICEALALRTQLPSLPVRRHAPSL